MANINDISKKMCTGCGACYSKCPNGAIEMRENNEGFLYPVIDESKCVNCGLCYKTCPIKTPVQKYEPTDIYAAWANKDVRMKSSAGGAFSAVANYFLAKGGAVCGAAWTDNYTKVVHKWIDHRGQLPSLRGSKYLQSEIGDTYKQAKKYLESGKPVLYSGCPCQIAGLKNYLGKDYDNLFLMDIVCHGVPSPKVYNAYINEISGENTVTRVDFREKSYWGWGEAVSLFRDDGSIYRENCYKDSYMVGFTHGFTTRKCCSSCQYAKMSRVGDFSIGDFWGIKEVSKKLDDAYGTSVFFVNSPKAKKVFKDLKNEYSLLEQVPVETVKELAKTKNGRLISPARENSRREKFFRLFNKNGGVFSEAFKGAQKYDVGYVGWWDSINYGSALTSFAMNRTLKNLGKSVVMLEHGGIRPGADSYGLQFARRFFECSMITNEKNFRRFNNSCDTFLVGSDQLWNWWNIRYNNLDFFFLDFVEKGHKRIAYATSFGKDDTDFPDDKRIRVGYNLSKFDSISVREKSGVELCKKEFGVDVTHVLDPVFLCDMDSYNEIIALSKKQKPKEYVFSYILDPTLDKIEMVKQAAQRLNLPYRIAIDALRDNDENSKAVIETILAEDENVVQGLRIEDWLSYVAGASYVVTDSFHGFCFSIIFGKNVIAYINERRGSARFKSIAETTGLESRLVTATQQIIDRGLFDTPIDYEDVRRKLAVEIDRSRKWLIDALEKPLRKTSVQELLLWKCIEHDRKINDAKLTEMREVILMLQERVDALEKKKKIGFNK